MKKQKGFSNMYLNMVRALIAFLFDSANIAITNSMLPFKNGAAYLKGNLATVDSLRNQAKAVIKGVAAQKRSLRKATTLISYTIMKSVFAYAVNTKNEDLKTAMKTTKGQLNRMKVTDFINFVQAAIDTVSPIINSLTDYGVTQQAVQNWQDILTQLDTINALPTTAIKHRKTLNDQAKSFLEQSLVFLREVMDPLALNFEESENAYFREYLNNRRLTNISVHTKFKIRVTNDVNEPQVNIPLLQNGTHNKTFTDINGEATLIVKVNEGKDTQPIYYFTIGNGQSAIQTGPVEIKKAHSVTKSYVIQPSGFIIPAPVSENVNA